ncbi:hypothetical protein HanIR_Chr06g0272751 [Helianthus annuus]|nr:hypothetical protein HanIR_Chr06g0272751 [Helianthus annuus]
MRGNPTSTGPKTRHFFLNGKERRVNHRDTGRCGQGRLLDRRHPLGFPKCAETRPPPLEDTTVE